MKINAKSYPNPVLGNSDDLGGAFRVELPYEMSRDTITLRPAFNLKNAGIEDLIKKGKASYVVEVQCNNTFYRRSFLTRNTDDSIQIPSKKLRERVTVGFYICADQDIKGYKPTDPHPDYEDADPFDVEAGGVLAVGGYSSFIAEKAFDPLRPPVSSFMSIIDGRHQEGPMEIDYDGEKITIELSKADWKKYLSVRGQKPVHGILHGFLALPALVDAIHITKKEDSGFEDKKWYGRLDAILEAQSLKAKDPYEAAQRILGNPGSRSFDGLENLTSNSEEETYE